MNASTWAALAAVCAVLGFGLALVIHIIKYSYAEGQKDQRLKALEARPANDCRVELAALTERFAALERTLTDVAHDVKNLLTGKVQVPRRRSDNDA